MSGISTRTIYASPMPVVAGQPAGARLMRFTDFALVVTRVGACLEPFTIHDLHNFDGMSASYDPRDMMRRVDKIASHSPTGELALFADEGKVLHDYNQWFRVGP
jgi:hypothetical protein